MYIYFLVIAFTFNVGKGDQITSQQFGPYYSQKTCQSAKKQTKIDIQTQGATIVSYACVPQPIEGD